MNKNKQLLPEERNIIELRLNMRGSFQGGQKMPYRPYLPGFPEMLAFIRDANTSQSVIDIFNRLYLELGPDMFRGLFQVLLGDNGSEFSNPSAIETDPQGNRRMRIFYCDPQTSYQKGAAENNHTLIRRIICC